MQIEKMNNRLYNAPATMMDTNITRASSDMSAISGIFFSQAEDGIPDWSVTGVQTCALPIWAVLSFDAVHATERSARASRPGENLQLHQDQPRRCRGCGRAERIRAPLGGARRSRISGCARSEERRVGKECG